MTTEDDETGEATGADVPAFYREVLAMAGAPVMTPDMLTLREQLAAMNVELDEARMQLANVKAELAHAKTVWGEAERLAKSRGDVLAVMRSTLWAMMPGAGIPDETLKP